MKTNDYDITLHNDAGHNFTWLDDKGMASESDMSEIKHINYRK